MLKYPVSGEEIVKEEAGTVILDAFPIDDIAEGSGTINAESVSLRQKPDINSAIVRTVAKSEKVLIIGEYGNWLKVRLYNNQDGYIMRKYINTDRIFMNETTDENNIEIKAFFEIGDLIDKFNLSLKKSPFASRYQIMPMLRLEDARKNNGIMTLTFIYSCINIDGNMLPSYRKNKLQAYMKQLLELILGKLMFTDADSFRIVINVPDFGNDGKVLGTVRQYAEIRLNRNDIKIEDLTSDISLIWKKVKSTIPVDAIFSSFPIG